MRVLILGERGQLGSCLKTVLAPSIEVIYKDSSQVNLCNINYLDAFFQEYTFDVIINAAAYTNVEKAEDEKDLAFKINQEAVKIIAQRSAERSTKLIHISTDYVFDGSKNTPYSETDGTNPISIYGQSKLAGEEEIQKYNPDATIIRTSWLYSPFGKNFYLTMKRLMDERNELKVVFDQVGTPTNCFDLSQAISIIIKNKRFLPGTFHYSNEGVCSWYDFAKAIARLNKKGCLIFPITSDEFPTKVKRPSYSVLNKSKFKNEFEISIPHWEDSLEKLILSS